MIARIAALLLVVILPIAVCGQVLPDTTASTIVELSIGHGSFAETFRDDSTGRVTRSDSYGFFDMTIAVTHIVGRLFRCGVVYGLASRVRPPDYVRPNASRTLSYATPKVGIDTKYFALDVGYLFNFNRSIVLNSSGMFRNRNLPSFGIRIGNRDALHFSGNFANNAPLFSGGGLLDLGMGFSAGTDGTAWIGMGAYPYESVGLIFKINSKLTTLLVLDARVKLGHTDNEIEYGIAAGFKALL